MPIAIYCFYRKEHGYSAGRSFGKMVIVELAFLSLSIVFFDCMIPLLRQATESSLKAFGVEAIVLLWFVLPFAILRWRTVRIRKAKKNEGVPAEESLEKAKNGIISIAEEGFSVTVLQGKKKHYTSINWTEVCEIRAFKRDLVTTDVICWSFYYPDEYNIVEVNEEMLGFCELEKAVESHYGIKQDLCWRKVAMPPFAENLTVIWSKPRG